ncbi:MAG TPA: DUF5668 domain-containing protein [Coriobacteriia bacterium]|nr:DUF5668 domain-containing protein [Coriobacteriia bacterium]
MDLKRAAEGLTVVGVGVVLLANTLGTLPWSVWWNILSLWPLLLVAIGLDIIGKGTGMITLRVLSSLLVLGGIAYGALVMPAGSGTPWAPFRVLGTMSESEPFSFSEKHDASLNDGVAVIDGGVGELTIKAGDVLASSAGFSSWNPRFDVSKDRGVADVRIALGEGGPWGLPGKAGKAELNVTLDRSVSWTLTVDSGVSETTADLSEMKLDGLTFKSGVSSAKVTMPKRSLSGASGGVPVSVDAGVSSLTLRFAKGDSVRLRVDRGISSVDLPSEFRGVGETGGTRTYETRTFSEKRFWDVRLDAGVSSINVELY